MSTPTSREASEPPLRFIMGAMALGMIVGAFVAPPATADPDMSAVLAAAMDDVVVRTQTP